MTFQGTTHRRLRRGLALFGGLALFAAACGNDDDVVAPADDDDVPAEAPDSVVIGIANERPFGFEEGGEATGEAPEVARAVFERIGVEISDFEVVAFEGLIDGLGTRFDVIAAGMFITPERAENVLFSNPDYCGTNAFAVPEGNPDNLSDFASVADSDAVLGVLSGAVEVGFAEDNDVPSNQIEVFPDVADVFDALRTGRVDAVALTSITVNEQVADLDGFEATEAFVPEVDGVEQFGCGGFGFTFEDQELRDAFNDALADMHAAGEIAPIIEPFGFTELDAEIAAETTANQLAEGAYDDLGDPPFEPANGADDNGDDEDDS